MVDTLAPKRDIGIMADYAVGGRGGLTMGLFNGDGQNITLQYVSRTTGDPGTTRGLGLAQVQVLF